LNKNAVHNLTTSILALSVLVSPAVVSAIPLNGDTDEVVAVDTTDVADRYVGNTLPGIRLTIQPGVTLTSNKVVIGYDAASDNNKVLVDGIGARWYSPGAVENTFHLGYNGSGNELMISNGGHVEVLGSGANHDALIGFNAGSDNNKMTVTGAGSLFSNATTFYIGRAGSNNSLVIENGGHVESFNVRIGGGTGSTGANPDSNSAGVDGAGSIWNIGGTLRVGSGVATTSNNNALNITNGGVVNVTGNTFLGYDQGSDNNSLFVSGPRSQLNAHDIVIGKVAGATGNALTISNSGTVRATSINFNGENGSLNLNRGATIISDTINSTSSTNTLNIHQGSAASYAYTVTGAWTVNDLDHRPMVTGSAYAAGIGAQETAAQMLYQRTSVITNALDRRLVGYASDAAVAPVWLDVYYADVGRRSGGDFSTQAGFSNYNYGVTAGFKLPVAITPLEAVVNVEQSTLNVDGRNQRVESSSLMAGLIAPSITDVFGAKLSAKALVGYAEHDGDRKVFTNSSSYGGSRNVSSDYDSFYGVVGTALTKLYPITDRITADVLLGLDLNTQHVSSYKESDYFSWDQRTLTQLQSRLQMGLDYHFNDSKANVFARVGVENRDLISGAVQDYAIVGKNVSFNTNNKNDTYLTAQIGTHIQLEKRFQLFGVVNTMHSADSVNSVQGNIGLKADF